VYSTGREKKVINKEAVNIETAYSRICSPFAACVEPSASL
jgi:hypothetical protein